MKKLSPREKTFIISFLVIVGISIIAYTSFIVIGKISGEQFENLLNITIQLITVFIAFGALKISLESLKHSQKTADRQNQLMEQEWLPYLSYDGVEVKASQPDGKLEERHGFRFILHFRNDGRCVLQYEITKFHAKLSCDFLTFPSTDEQHDDIQRKNSGYGLIGIKSKAEYGGTWHYTELGSYAFTHDEFGKSVPIAAECKIQFAIKFWDFENPETKYQAEHEVSMMLTSDGKWRSMKSKMVKFDKNV